VLPMNVSNPTFQVTSSDPLAVNFEPNGTEFVMPTLPTYGMDYSSTFPTFNEINVRCATSSKTSTFFMSARLQNSLAL
jgi:hypothetical protein